MLEIRPVATDDVLPIRRRVLRAGMPAAAARFEGDEAPDTLHVGAFLDERLVAVATVVRRSPPGDAGHEGAWQVRGMATQPAVRGRGVGGSLLDMLVEHARSQGASYVWCNARLRAVAFYERHGFVRSGEVFEIERLGQHVRMRLRL